MRCLAQIPLPLTLNGKCLLNSYLCYGLCKDLEIEHKIPPLQVFAIKSHFGHKSHVVATVDFGPTP